MREVAESSLVNEERFRFQRKIPFAEIALCNTNLPGSFKDLIYF